MAEQLTLLPRLFTAHLQLTLLALAVATAISVPVGVVATRVRWIERTIVGAAGIIQTVPGLALLAVMVPVLAALRLPSIGFLPAFIGLTAYGVLPILRNTVTGIEGVDPALVEAARGVGMTGAQQLWRVELPLALPVVVAGLRTSAVWVVGMATLATPVGAASLGNYIFGGLQTRNFRAVVVGCVAAAVLALALDGLVHGIEAAVRRRSRRRLVLSVAAFLLLAAYAAGAALLPAASGRGRPVVIGAKNFTEQYILGALLAGVVRHETGRDVRLVPSLGSTVAFDALLDGSIDAYVDYSGTIWTTIMRRTDVPSRQQVLDEVVRYLRETAHVPVIAALGFENAYALAMRRADARRLGVARVSDLVAQAPRLSIGSDYEFFARPEWVALERMYGLSFATRRTMDPALMYQAIGQGSVDVISAYTTDGRIAAYNLVVLEDDRQAIPPYDAVILARPGFAELQPDVVAALRRLDGAIDADRMRRLNGEVDENGRSPSVVAAEFVRRLLDSR